jgi:hypothetical protein
VAHRSGAYSGVRRALSGGIIADLLSSSGVHVETEFLAASIINLVINLLYTLLALVVGVYALLWIDKKLLKNIDFEEELKKGNLAVAVFVSTILIFIAIMIAFGFRG